MNYNESSQKRTQHNPDPQIRSLTEELKETLEQINAVQRNVNILNLHIDKTEIDEISDTDLNEFDDLLDSEDEASGEELEIVSESTENNQPIDVDSISEEGNALQIDPEFSVEYSFKVNVSILIKYLNVK